MMLYLRIFYEVFMFFRGRKKNKNRYAKLTVRKNLLKTKNKTKSTCKNNKRKKPAGTYQKPKSLPDAERVNDFRSVHAIYRVRGVRASRPSGCQSACAPGGQVRLGAWAGDATKDRMFDTHKRARARTLLFAKVARPARTVSRVGLWTMAALLPVRRAPVPCHRQHRLRPRPSTRRRIVYENPPPYRSE